MTQISTKFKMSYPDAFRIPAHLCAFLLFVEILVPQITLIGRPWLISATFGMWLVCARGPKLTDTIKRAGPLAILPLITLLITFYKMYTSGGTMERHMPFVAGPIYLSLTTFVCCFYLLHYPRVLQQIRILSVIVLGAVIAYGLSIVYAEAGVGRILAMQKSVVLAYGFDPDALTLRGVPGYAIIYTIAMVGLLLVSWVRDARCISRQTFFFYVAALIILMTHVVLSTLTLAVFAGGLVLVSGLLLYIWLSHVRHRITVMCGIVLMALALSQLEHIQFVVAKTSRLATGMTTQGIEDGDETGRGGRLIRSLNTFYENPLLGCDFSSEKLEKGIGDHSSLIDPLGMYGILGCLPMLLYHFVIVRNGLRTWYVNRRNLRGIGELGAWTFYGACSFWNTTTYTVLPLALLFLQLVPPGGAIEEDEPTNRPIRELAEN